MKCNRRIRIRGVVTGYMPGTSVEVSDFTTAAMFRYVRNVLYVDDGTGAARIETEQAQRVRPGAVVDVAGFPAVTPGKPILSNAHLPGCRRGAQPAQPRAMIVATANVLTPEHDAALVRMEAHFLSMLRTPTERILVLRVGESVFDANLEADAGDGCAGAASAGQVVAVTGVYSFQWGPPPTFRLFLRSADDVTVLAAAPWWTLRHSAVMVAILALGAALAAFWVRAAADAEAAAVPGGPRSSGGRVARELHDTLEQGLAGISLQLEAVAGSAARVARARAGVARRRAEDAALQPGRGAAFGHGSAVAGAREPRPRRRADRSRRSDDASAGGRSRRRGSRARRTGSMRRKSITCCASVSKR